MGLSVPEVALITGHKDVRQLFRYTHLKPENLIAKYSQIFKRLTMKFNQFLKYFKKFIIRLPDEEQLKKRRTREKDLIETFAKDDVDLDYANRWNAPLLKKKVKTKTMIIINSILVCIMIYLIVK